MKIVIKATGMVFLPLLGILFLNSSSSIHSKTDIGNLSLADQTESLPKEIRDLVESSCINCHSTDGRALARTKLNFSVWNEYDSEKQANKSEDMCEMLTKGKMPPKSYLKNHGDQVPTAGQIEAVCKWAEGMKNN
ncbi:MAG TPA: heme-binding domain-containing protein [Bacteroidales bacterium]|jgi:hypothetical protein|nr:heme-binding domain-containing protein [Bacteroidales bacterium]